MKTIFLNEMLLGGTAVACLIAALLFIRYWRSTRDRFFVFFALSFGIEGINRLHMGLSSSWSESLPLHYVVRLVTFGLILIAIWDKNRPHR